MNDMFPLVSFCGQLFQLFYSQGDTYLPRQRRSGCAGLRNIGNPTGQWYLGVRFRIY